MPFRFLRPPSPGTVTWMGPVCGFTMPQLAAALRSIRDALIADSYCAELCRADHAVLPTGHLSNQAAGIGAFLTHQVSKAPARVPRP